MTTEVAVSAPSRLHIGLFDLGRATARSFGGIGLAIRDPRTEVFASPFDSIRVEAPGATEATRRLIEERLCSARARFGTPGATVVVRQAPPEHVGLGSKTSLVLAALTAATGLWKVSASREQIQAISGRGGASGVGVNGFFTGGLVIDGGHSGRVPLVPSSARTPISPPPVVVQRSFPSAWQITLVLDRTGVGRSGEEEREFFRRSTPIPSDEVWRSIALAYHEIVPALETEDLEAFGAAVRGISETGFKRREILGQSESTRALLRTLQQTMPCAGLSSMGPLIYVVTRGPGGDALAQVADRYLVIETVADNRGYTVTRG